jgi:translocation and assembly module TamB
MAPELRVEFDAQGLSLLARKDWALNIDTQGVFHAVRDRASLTGSLKINHALLGELDESGPELSEDVRIAGKEWIPPPERKPVRLHTDISLDLGERVRVRTRPVRAGVVDRLPMTNTGLDAKLAGKLRIRGDSLAAPNATGEIQIVDGQYMVFGQRLKIVRGRIIFDGPLLDPNLNIVARRDDPEVVVGVRVTGTARAPRVTLFSQPDVSDTEKLTWLLFGRGAQPVDYSVTGLSTASSTVSSFGFQLSKRLYLAYEQGVSGTGSIMRLYSQLTKHLSAQWRSGSENSVRLFYGFFVK